MIPSRPLHADVTDRVTVIETGVSAKIIGFYKIEQISHDTLGTVDACLDCLPDDPDMHIIGLMEERETFYRPWELSWQGEGPEDHGLRDEARDLQRSAVASQYGSLPQACYPTILKKFRQISSHERIQASSWQKRTRKLIAERIQKSS